MKTRLVYLALSMSITALSACKLEVQVPSGATVTAASGLVCRSGENCEIDVVDFQFDETFDVQVAQGYRFLQWSRQTHGLCSALRGACRLSNAGLAQSESAIAFVASNRVLTIAPVVWEVPDGAFELEFRPIAGEPVLRDASGVAIGSIQPVFNGRLGYFVSVHFRNRPETYTLYFENITLIVTPAQPPETRFDIFYGSSACDADDPVFAAPVDGGDRPSFAYLDSTGRVMIPDPEGTLTTLAQPFSAPNQRGAECGMLEGPLDVYPLVPTDLVLAFPLRIEGERRPILSSDVSF